VFRIFLTAVRLYAVVGFPDDRGEQLLATENLQPVNWKTSSIPSFSMLSISNLVTARDTA